MSREPSDYAERVNLSLTEEERAILMKAVKIIEDSWDWHSTSEGHLFWLLVTNKLYTMARLR